MEQFHLGGSSHSSSVSVVLHLFRGRGYVYVVPHNESQFRELSFLVEDINVSDSVRWFVKVRVTQRVTDFFHSPHDVMSTRGL